MSQSILAVGINAQAAISSLGNLARHYSQTGRSMVRTSHQTASALAAANRTVTMSLNSVNYAVNDAANRIRWYGLAATLALGQIIKANTDFEFSMRRVKAILSLNEAQYGSLREEALRLGRVTEWTAKNVAEAMGNLAIAGFDMNEVVAVMPSMLAMATAGNVSLQYAAESAAGVLRAFTKDAEQMNSVAGVLTSTFTRTNTTLESITNSLRYVGPVANKTGVELEEVAAAVGILGDAGVRGSMAGTSLRMMFLRLAKGLGTDAGPAVFSMAKAIERLRAGMAEGQKVALDTTKIFEESGEGYRRFDHVVQHLGEVFEGMDKEQQNAYLTAIVGARAATGAMALLSRGADDLRNKMQVALFGGMKNSLEMIGRVFESYDENFQRMRKNLGAFFNDAESINSVIRDYMAEIPWHAKLRLRVDGKEIAMSIQQLEDEIRRRSQAGGDVTNLLAARDIMQLTSEQVTEMQNRINKSISAYIGPAGEATEASRKFIQVALQGLPRSHALMERYRGDVAGTFQDMDFGTSKAAASFQALVGIIRDETIKANQYLETLSPSERLAAETERSNAIYEAHMARIRAISEKFLGTSAQTVLNAIRLDEERNKPLKETISVIEAQMNSWKRLTAQEKAAAREHYIVDVYRSLQKVFGDTRSEQELLSQAQKEVTDVLSGYSATMRGFMRQMLATNSAIGVQREQLSSLMGLFKIVRSAVANTAIKVGAALEPLFLSVSEWLITIQNRSEELLSTGSNVVNTFSGAVARAFTGFNRGVRPVKGLVDNFKQLENNVQRSVYFITLLGAALLPLGASLLFVNRLSMTLFTTIGAITKIIPILTVGILPLAATLTTIAGLWLAWRENLGGLRDVLSGFGERAKGVFDMILKRALAIGQIWEMLRASRGIGEIIQTESIRKLFTTNEALIKTVRAVAWVRNTLRDVILEFRQLGSSGNRTVQRIVAEFKSFLRILKEVALFMVKIAGAIWRFAAAHPQLVKIAALFFVFQGPLMMLAGLFNRVTSAFGLTTSFFVQNIGVISDAFKRFALDIEVTFARAAGAVGRYMMTLPLQTLGGGLKAARAGAGMAFTKPGAFAGRAWSMMSAPFAGMYKGAADMIGGGAKGFGTGLAKNFKDARDIMVQARKLTAGGSYVPVTSFEGFQNAVSVFTKPGSKTALSGASKGFIGLRMNVQAAGKAFFQQIRHTLRFGKAVETATQAVQGAADAAGEAAKQTVTFGQRFRFFSTVLRSVIAAWILIPPIFRGIVEGFNKIVGGTEGATSAIQTLKNVFGAFIEGFNLGWQEAIRWVQTFASIVGMVIGKVVEVIGWLMRAIFGVKSELNILSEMFSRDAVKVIGFALGVKFLLGSVKDLVVGVGGLAKLLGGFGLAGWLAKLSGLFVTAGGAIKSMGAALIAGEGVASAFTAGLKILGVVFAKLAIVASIIYLLFRFVKAVMQAREAGLSFGQTIQFALMETLRGLGKVLLWILRILWKIVTLGFGSTKWIDNWANALDNMGKNQLKRFAENAAETQKKAFEQAAGANLEAAKKANNELRNVLAAMPVEETQRRIETQVKSGVAGAENVLRQYKAAFEKYSEVRSTFDLVSRLLEQPLEPAQIARLRGPLETLRNNVGNIAQQMEHARGNGARMVEALRGLERLNLRDVTDAVNQIQNARVLEQASAMDNLATTMREAGTGSAATGGSFEQLQEALRGTGMGRGLVASGGAGGPGMAVNFGDINTYMQAGATEDEKIEAILERVKEDLLASRAFAGS